MEITTENINNNYSVITQLNLYCDSWGTPNQFGAFFATYQPILTKEIQRYKDYCNDSGSVSAIKSTTDDVPFTDTPF